MSDSSAMSAYTVRPMCVYGRGQNRATVRFPGRCGVLKVSRVVLNCPRCQTVWPALPTTQAEIGEQEEIDQSTVAKITDAFMNFSQMAENHKVTASYMSDEWFPYNVWKQQTKTPGSSHFGNSEISKRLGSASNVQSLESAMLPRVQCSDSGASPKRALKAMSQGQGNSNRGR